MTTTIDVKELIQKYSVEELNETADQYFKQFDANADVLLSKPFVDIAETPELLMAFACQLQGIQFFPGMKVLDFGAGSCWTSRFMAQLGCAVTASDVSATALEIGKELFRRNPLFGDHSDPEFVVFDGHQLPFEAETFDAITISSSFHHVPNQLTVLKEFFRVLNDGGIAAFSEPGPTHSLSEQSQFEMKNFTVIENDIHIDSIWSMAKEIGFKDIKIHPFYPIMKTMTLEDFNQYRETGHNSEMQESMHQFVDARRLFFLHKPGDRVKDSRQTVGHGYTLEISTVKKTFKSNEIIELDMVISNSGSTTWLPSSSTVGPVRLGAKRVLPDGKESDYLRASLMDKTETNIVPGQSIAVRIELTGLDVGHHRIKFDLVSEHLFWFENVGCEPTLCDVEVT